MIRIASTLVAAAVACAPWSVHAAEGTRVRLEVDTSTLPESSTTNALTRWLAQDQTRTILDAGLEVAPDAPVGIRVVVSRYGEHETHYKAVIMLVDENDVVSQQREVTCELCTDGQLISLVTPEVARLTEQVIVATANVAAEPVEEAPPPEPEPAEAMAEPPAPAQPSSKAFGGLGTAGIASAVAGFATTGVGIGLALAPDRRRFDQQIVENRSTRPAGLTLVGLGAALVVTGAVLVGVDVTRRKKERRVSVLPELTGSLVRISFSMRF